jgi:hypothetical protein
MRFTHGNDQPLDDSAIIDPFVEMRYQLCEEWRSAYSCEHVPYVARHSPVCSVVFLAGDGEQRVETWNAIPIALTPDPPNSGGRLSRLHLVNA